MTSCFAATGPKSLNSNHIEDTYPFLMNTWNTLPESYQKRVYNNTLGTVKCQIQQAENPTTDMVISTEESRVENAILIDYLTSKVAVNEPEIKSTDQIIPMDNYCPDDELHFVCQGAAGNLMIKITEAMSVMPAPPLAGHDVPRLHSRGLTWEPVMSKGMRALTATMRIRMRLSRKKHRTLMMDLCR